MPSDTSEVDFEIHQSPDSKKWTITCDEPLAEADFADTLIDLGTDILDGAVSLGEDTAVDKKINRDRH